MVVLASVAGESLAIIIEQRVTIEGSTPICSMIGYLLGINLLLWRKWERYSSERLHMLLFLVLHCLLRSLSRQSTHT